MENGWFYCIFMIEILHEFFFVELLSYSLRSEFSFNIFIILSTVYRERLEDFS